MADPEAPADPQAETHVAAAWEAYRAADPARAERAARAALEADHGWGPAWNALACALERAGRMREADQAFRRAATAPRAPEGAPYRVSWARWQREVDAAAAALPPRLREALDEVTLELADYADPALLAGYDEPELMGMFLGTPRSEREAGGDLSPRIVLWRRAHEHAVSDSRSFSAEVRQTLHHELGHYLGLDEDELDRLGMD